MKKIYTKLYLLGIICLALFSSCAQEDPIIFNAKDAYVAFVAVNYSIRENNAKELIIPVAASDVPGTALTVNFEIGIDDASGYRQAEEGVDYTLLNTSTQLHFPTGVGYDTIRIQPIDNAIKDGHSSLRIKLTNANQPYSIGFNGQRTYTNVLIYDDESMSKYEGTWHIEGKSAVMYVNGARKETADTTLNTTVAIFPYDVKIVAHPTELNTFIIKNFFNESTLEGKMIIDESTNTLTLVVGEVLGYINSRPIYLDSFTDRETVEFSVPVEGKIVDDTTLKVYRYAALLLRDGTYYLVHDSYYVLKSTWTKID